VAAVEALLSQALACDQAIVPFDLTGLDYLSSRAVGQLMRVAGDRPPRPAPVVLCAASGQPAQMLGAVDPGERLPRYATVAAAVAAAVANPQCVPRWAHLSLTCDWDRWSPRSARAFVTRVCTDWHLKGLVDEVSLLASELVTNAVVHAASAPNVAIHLLPDRIHVEVADADSAELHPQEASPDAESGRGLVLVEALAYRWGQVALPDGKVVWFDVLRLA
jgi:hypothetical protein